MADVSRRALLRSFLLAPVAVRLAPFVRPAALEPVSRFAMTPVNLLAFQRSVEELFVSQLATFPVMDWLSPAEHAALTDGTPLPPDPTEFYEGNFFHDRDDTGT